jgi:predicted unusual protein kinase regulating ubiquinone biosynthesis (AarF/ABC1/UbiB family)
MLTRDPDGAERDDPAERAAAESIASAAASLKGGMAKVAQLMAYLEGPGAAVDAGARAALGTLWDQVPGADPQAIRAVVEADLGRPIAELFVRWDDTPLAAASLGEVHFAALDVGVELAVKVQYPGVAEALRSDLESRALLGRLAGVDVGRALPPASLTALRDAVLGELDYVAERRAMEKFAARFRGDPAIVVPRTFAERSSPRVLAAERLFGAPLLTWAHTAPASERAAVGLTIFRFAWSAPLVHGLLNADPNPGNYLVLGGAAGRVGFLDYGCVVELDEPTLAAERRVWLALLFGDGEQFRHALYSEGLIAHPRVFDASNYRDWERHVVGPFLGEGEFEWTAAYARAYAELTSELVRARALILPPGAILLWRQRLGVAAVLGSIMPRADFRAALGDIARRAKHMMTE